MLLVPLTCCIAVCECSRRLRGHFPGLVIDYAQLTAAIFLIFGLMNANLGRPPDLALAVKRKWKQPIRSSPELQGVVRAAKDSPDRSVILDAYGPGAYEGIYSVRTYLTAFGTQNLIALRFHPNEKLKGSLFASLQRQLADIAGEGDRDLVPLKSALQSRECVSVGLYGPPDATCTGFEINAN